VYESIKAPGILSPEALAHFDVEGEDLLYELRFLAIKHRGPAAAYIAAYNLRWGLPGWVAVCTCLFNCSACACTTFTRATQLLISRLVSCSPVCLPACPTRVPQLHHLPVLCHLLCVLCSPQESQVLARAFKEHERRDGRREGFLDTPGDVMAYKHYRDVS
jgi:hypothetical protein